MGRKNKWEFICAYIISVLCARAASLATKAEECWGRPLEVQVAEEIAHTELVSFLDVTSVFRSVPFVKFGDSIKSV